MSRRAFEPNKETMRALLGSAPDSGAEKVGRRLYVTVQTLEISKKIHCTVCQFCLMLCRLL